MAENTIYPPVVAIPADTRELDGYQWHSAEESYLRAITAGIGGIPLIVPSFADAIDIDALLGRVDGILLTGSRSNIHPNRYDTAAGPKSEPYDNARDALSLPLIKAALQRGVPLFAICRGMQELNVSLGGSLFPDLHEVEGRIDHRAPQSESRDERFAIRQDVNLVPGGTLSRLFSTDKIRVNSLHRQGIDRLGDGLAVEATAPDGTIEAVIVADAPSFALGVQWHPEYWIASDETSAKLFAAFGAAIRSRMARLQSVMAEED